MSALRKQKPLKKSLGSDFEVKSCFGHIRDLEKDEMGIDVENNFEPTLYCSGRKRKSGEGIKSAWQKNQMKYGWQRMRTVKEKPSAGICVKYWA